MPLPSTIKLAIGHFLLAHCPALRDFFTSQQAFLMSSGLVLSVVKVEGVQQSSKLLWTSFFITKFSLLFKAPSYIVCNSQKIQTSDCPYILSDYNPGLL